MELQIELMIFTLFVCLGAGTFAALGALVCAGKGNKLQLPALITSLGALGIGGIGSFLHLQHWERIFNGFGHLTSGITQELIAIVVFVIALVIYFIVYRRSEGTPPKWTGIMALVISVILIIVMAHSYNMAARPAWDTPLLWIYYLCSAALLGTLALSVIAGLTSDEAAPLVVKASLFSGIASAIATFAYAIYFMVAGSSFTNVGYYFDPTHPTKAMAEPGASFTGVFSGDSALLFWVGVVVVGLVVPIVLSFLAKKKQPKQIALYTGIGLIGALIGGMCFRILLYVLGFSVFVFY